MSILEIIILLYIARILIILIIEELKKINKLKRERKVLKETKYRLDKEFEDYKEINNNLKSKISSGLSIKN